MRWSREGASRRHHPSAFRCGIRSDEEVAALDALGVDAIVGMALYRGKLQSIPGVEPQA